MAGKKGPKTRFRADGEKRLICVQALAPGVSVAQVARRHAMNANLIFKWLKVPRFSPAADETPDAPEGGGVVLPVQISGRPPPCAAPAAMAKLMAATIRLPPASA
ncbi:MAG: transposase [Paracoccus sp. (in: a-proteobacteria)]|uniref:transposase n=1 Tax=Paracoccus sp. TaxID=267 RepID=UPI00391C9E20